MVADFNVGENRPTQFNGWKPRHSHGGKVLGDKKLVQNVGWDGWSKENRSGLVCEIGCSQSGKRKARTEKI